MTVHTFGKDGEIMISEIVIDIALKRTKGRVTREDEMDLALIANEIRKQRDQYEDLMKAAIGYIKRSPCDPDHTEAQMGAYSVYQDLLKKYEDNQS